MDIENIDFIWRPDERLDFGEYSRVHAFLVTPDGRALLRYKNGEARVTGGRIDADDRNLEEALKRELKEEINVEVDRIDYLGYVEVCDRQSKICDKWARMVARVREIGEPKPDPDRKNNWVYGRTLAPVEVAHREMDTTFPTNRGVLDKALAVAAEKGYFTKSKIAQTQILNMESHD